MTGEPEEQRQPLAVVTGASGGFGLAVARALVADGWEVVTISRRHSAELEQLGAVAQIRGDVAEPDLSELLRVVADRPLDLLVNNAGVGGTATRLAELSRQELEKAFAVNVLAPALVSGALIPNLERSERALIVNVSSRLASLSRQAAGDYGHLDSSYAYRVTKAAQNMLTISMAGELGPSIRVWALHPGRLTTAMGGADADGDPAEAAERLVTLVREGPHAQLQYIALDEGPLPW